MNIVEGIIPPRGWHYVSPTGYRVPAQGEAHNFLHLVDLISKHRLENRLDVGNPSKDAEEYLCSSFPHVCGGHTNTGSINVHSVSAPSIGRPVDLVNSWANVLLDHKEKVELVPANEANQRSMSCRGCIYNQEWENGCGPCISTARRALAILRQGNDVKEPEQMRYCGLHRIETRTAVWLERRTFGPVNAPDYCWLR